MVDNPYKVLGISEGASADEIKKAYRKKAKECHPDLHPNDPHAQEKMNDVNEAYDMLTNPEKYASRKASASSYGQSSQSYQNSSYNRSYNSGSQNSQSYGRYSSYSGNGGWSTSSFGADDFFNFFFGGMNGMGGNVNTAPRQEAFDSADIVYAINCINSRRYQDALSRLVRIPSTQRNARWFYLSALANQGIGNSIRAREHIQRAVELDPNNQVYKTVYRNIANNTGYSYSSGNSGSYGSSSYSKGYSNQNSYSNNGYTYRRRTSSPLGIFGRILLFMFMMRIIRIIFALMMSGGMYQMMR